MKGFTLTEMLITMTLGLLLISLLLKIYAWQLNIHHKIDDMVFLDHNGVLAMKILINTAYQEKSVEETHEDGITYLVIDDKKFKIEKNALWFRKSPGDKFLEIVPGVDKLTFDGKVLKIHLRGPYHTQGAQFSESVKIPAPHEQAVG